MDTIRLINDVHGQTPSLTEPSSPSFVFTLPLELLSAIVDIIAENELPCAPVSTLERKNVQKESDPHMRARLWDPMVQRLEGSLGWIKMTHVCRVWREYICGSMPLLWAEHIGCFHHHSDALEEMLRRAGENAPLAVQSGARGDAFAMGISAWNLLQRPMPSWSEAKCVTFQSRVRSIRIVDLRYGAPIGDRDPPPRVMDNLSDLQVMEVHHLYLKDDTFDDEEKLLKPGAPLITSPNLRKIRFTNYFIPWKAVGLTHLSIALGHCNGLPRTVIFGVLASIAPTVQVLELDFCLPGAPFDDVTVARSFPRLRHLYLRDTDDCVHDVLKIFQPTSTSLMKLDLTINPDSRSWRSSIKSIVQCAVRLLRRGGPLTFMSATQARSEDIIFGSLHDYIRLGFSEGTPNDLFLTIAMENARHVRDHYPSCLADICAGLDNALPTLWCNIEVVDLNLPLWNFSEESYTLILHCMDHDILDLRIVDPLEHVDTHNVVWEASVLSDVFCSHTERLDRLWIVQHGDWLPEQLSTYCSALAAGLWQVSTELVVDKNGHVPCKLPRIELLRVDLVYKSEAPHLMNEKDLITILGRVAERVELHLL